MIMKTKVVTADGADMKKLVTGQSLVYDCFSEGLVWSCTDDIIADAIGTRVYTCGGHASYRWILVDKVPLELNQGGDARIGLFNDRIVQTFFKTVSHWIIHVGSHAIRGMHYIAGLG